MRFLYLASLCIPLSIWSEQKMVYQSSTEGVHIQTEWVVDHQQEPIGIVGKNRGNDIQLKYSPSFSLLHYVETGSTAKAFEVVREGSMLIINNETKTKKLKLGNLPWVQEFKFGFKPFLQSSDQEFIFGIVYNKDNTLQEMIATKEKIETVTVNNQTYETQKLKITLTGFKKRFWKAEAWFDVKTKLMVQYRSNEGPRTPMTEVILLDFST
ncbi:MAG: hypothetical protein K2Y01_05540 [Rhabdochlamydiaceae bacterium]|nr:hypothetical protein [Rhabdochlamydiaceae bacterium]